MSRLSNKFKCKIKDNKISAIVKAKLHPFPKTFLFQKSLVMTHHHLALKGTYSFEGNTYYDEHCCTAEGYVYLCEVLEDDRENCDKCQE